MAIGNVTPDSFYAASRIETDHIVSWAHQALADGAQILDIGACSTRPNSVFASEEEEWIRLEPALTALKEAMPEARLSVDTFRPFIAQRALELFGPLIINDISGGCEEMYELVRRWQVPYVWTLRGQLDLPRQADMQDIDLILDPGFGFIGGVEQDYACMRRMEQLQSYGRDILVGVSRKSMLWKPLQTTPDECLPATQVLHLYALQHGATILRVHDVKKAVQTVTIWEKLQ